MTTEELWISVTTCLKSASQAASWAFWRERFNTNHPENIRQQEIEDPAQFAYANWVAAKHVYCANKEALDNYLKFLMYERAYPGLSQEVELFIAMRKTVEKEVDEQLEQHILKENDMGRKPKPPEVLNEDELIDDPVDLDEDDQYLREGRSDLWDGDEYLGPDEFDDDIDWGHDDEE